MVMQARPFRLLMKVASPIILKTYPPSLDGLLYAAMESHYGRQEDLIGKMKAILSWNEAGFFHGSSMRFVVTNDATLTATQAHRTDYLKSKMDSQFFAPNGRGGKYTKVVVAGGPYKNRMTKRNAYSAPYVIFDGYGNREAVTELISYYLCGVGYDAQNNGQGEVTDIESFDLDTDLSISINAKANRSIPSEYAKSQGITGMAGYNRVIPPYYSGEPVPVIMPEHVRTIHLLDTAKAI